MFLYELWNIFVGLIVFIFFDCFVIVISVVICLNVYDYYLFLDMYVLCICFQCFEMKLGVLRW